MRIRFNGAKKIGLGGKKQFGNGGFQATVRERIYAFILRLRYLRLLAETNILIGLSGAKRELDFKRQKPNPR